MFTGIITAVGRVGAVARKSGGLRLRIESGGLRLGDVAVGDSISVNGICLTVVVRKARSFEADVSQETLDCTSGFNLGARVNLEKSLRLADRVGGHFVSGHVDGVGTVGRVAPAGGNRVMAVKAPAALAKYIARKGSITLSGVSLTVNAMKGTEFTVNLIPHTLAKTNLGELRTGGKVNLEVDLLARYAERLHKAR